MARRLGALGTGLITVLALGGGATTGAAGAATGTAMGSRPAGTASAAVTVAWTDPTGSAELDAPACVPLGSTSAPEAYRRPDAPPALPARAARRPRPVAVFLGDSYTSGWRGVGEGSAGWPAILGAARHWTIYDLAVAGTGFVNPGWTSQPIGSQVGTAIRLQPGIVFVAGGHNDEDLATGPVTAAADSVLDGLARALPHAVLVVVGPIWPDGNPKATLVRLRDHLRARATDLGALFIDPIGSGWFAGGNARFIGPDGTHPTSLGYRRIARLVGAALETDPRLSASLARDVVSAPGAAPASTTSTSWTAGPAGLSPCAS
jgi:lysophospholipase L1-like esterase